MCSDSFLFFFLLLFPPSTALSLLFNPSSFLIIFFSLFSLFYIIFFFFFFFFSHLFTQECNLHPHTTNTCVHQATEVNATNQTVHYKYNFKMRSSIINCHTTNTVYVVHQTTKLIELTLL